MTQAREIIEIRKYSKEITKSYVTEKGIYNSCYSEEDRINGNFLTKKLGDIVEINEEDLKKTHDYVAKKYPTELKRWKDE